MHLDDQNYIHFDQLARVVSHLILCKNVTQGISKAAIIFAATVVLPEALPPQIPLRNKIVNNQRMIFKTDYLSPMTKGSTCCPAELYQGGRPAV
jgi:hypothetical protein